MKFMKTIMKQSQIYTQTAQRNIITNNIENYFNHSENRIKKYIEKLKWERIKIKILLIIYNINNNIKNQLINMNKKIKIKKLYNINWKKIIEEINIIKIIYYIIIYNIS